VLKKIVTIKNVGRFKNGNATGDVQFGKATLIYAPNGRGKTTFCDICRLLKTSIPDPILGRAPLGTGGRPRRQEGLREICLGRMSEDHNEAYYSVEGQWFLGEEGFGEKISRLVGEKEQRKRKKPIETDLEEIAWQLKTTVELLQGTVRRWEISGKRTKAVAVLVRGREHTVSEVAKFLGRDEANVSMILSRASARERNQ
jgi:hypothetical protein